MEKSRFIDTNIVFDALYSTRPLYQNFHKELGQESRFKMLYVTISVVREVHIIATESGQILSRILHNEINSVDWDGLSPQGREDVLKMIQKKLDDDTEVKVKKRRLFVLDAIRLLTPQLITSNKDEIVKHICPHLHYLYLRDIQDKIASRFSIPPVNGGHADFDNLITAIKDTNQKSNAFNLGDSQDFDIASDLIMLVSVGARYANALYEDFYLISFYTRDNGFISNFNAFSTHVSGKIKKTKYEDKIVESVNKINFVKPY